MSIIKSLPRSTRFIPVQARFLALFNSPSLGLYRFDGASNTNVVLTALRKSCVYLIEQFSFVCSIDQAAFLEAVAVVPNLQFIKTNEGTPVFEKVIPCLNYIDNSEVIQFFVNDLSGNNLAATFRGALRQPASLVGVPFVWATIGMNIYEVTDHDYVCAFREDHKDSKTLIQVE